MIKAVVLGAGGFIGHNLCKRLKQEGYHVTGVDLKHNEFESVVADEFHLIDLRDLDKVRELFNREVDEVYQLAADMGGAGYVFTGEHDADIMQNSARINLNVLEVLKNKTARIFYASSACIYPEENQQDPENPQCAEETAYPANPDSEYGWEKLFSERLFQSYARNYSMDIRIARLHNVYGPYGIYDGGKEKAPAALCRKVISADENGFIELWGDGKQTRSFMYIDDCLEGIIRLMRSNCTQVVNIGSDELVSIDELAQLIITIGGKSITIKHVHGPQGVRGRCSSNEMLRTELGWAPSTKLSDGIRKLYHWIDSDLNS